ncbi:hypothetical protein [Hydrogenophaga sp.]|uniref:hypothetical protein n=1 Tax=Hydrogenophaga sp. TaxID=1904254 RepID=UPI00271671EF|nr:hypothetical protein [Hydrogenophaga sp.]MDO9438531.1 hypothetical protein [Hydrogenophaga sp.]
MKTPLAIGKQITKLGLLLMMGVTMSADAGFFGLGGTSWKEEVLLHDAQKIIVERSQSRGGRREIGQPPPVKEHAISFTLPSSNERITWTSEYGEDVGRANFDLLAIHVMKGVPYIVATPNLCLSYNKWGRPNPPYVIFKYDGKAWQRIPMSELPAEFKTINVAVSTLGDEDKLTGLGFVSAEKIKELNSDVKQPEYKTILREALPQKRINQMCMEMVPYKGSWVMPNDPIARKFIDQQKR